MAQRDFNRDMDSYLKRRKSSPSIINKFKSVPKVEIVRNDRPPSPDDIDPELVKAMMRGEKVSLEPESEFEPQRVIREPWWRRLFSSISIDSKDLIDNDDDLDMSHLAIEPKSPKVDDDVKEMLKICVSWIARLPAEEIHEIRESSDYLKFKNLLDKYGLLKK